MVGPKYHKPETAMPTQFEELPTEVSADDVDLREWWKLFNDPVLDDLIDEAIAENYDLQIALEKIVQARSQYRIDRSRLWPEIDLNATATRTRLSKNLFPPLPEAETAATGGSGLFPRFLNIFQIGFDAIWEFDFFGKFRHQKKASHYLWEASHDDYQSALISMLSEVAVNYMSIRSLQNQIALTLKKIEVDENQLAIAHSLYDVGIDNALQITSLISQVETDRAELPVLETSLKQTIYALAYLLGRQPEGLVEMFDEVQPIPRAEGKLPVGIPSDLLRRRPDVRSAERQLAAATELTGAAIADYFPHFALNGLSFSSANAIGSTAGLESYKLKKLFQLPSRMFSFGLGMNWDMIDFGRVRGNVNLKRSEQRQALLTYEQTVIASLKDVESALVAYFQEQERMESIATKVDADRATFEITYDLFKVGLATEIQVIETERALIDSETILVQSEQSLAGDLIAIYKAIGGDWAN